VGINLSIPLKIPCLCSRNSWVDAVEEKNRDTGEILSDTDTAEDAYCTKARRIQKGLPLLDLAIIKDFLRFHVAISRGRIDDERTTVNSVNIFAE